MLQDNYATFITKMKEMTGIDLACYKETQMKRRIISLYEKRGYTSFQDYFVALCQHRELLNEFLDRITINVSEFYRNRNRWEVLEEKFLPSILKGTKSPRIWSAACSTGEEPYTIAMILSKYLPLSEINILATDIDEKAILKAKAGLYSERSLNDIPEDMKRKYFTREGHLYRISKELQRSVVFKRHNLLSDSFGGPYDIIICRNVLIYFTEDTKRVLYEKFSHSLKTDGILFVGSTEQIFDQGRYHLESADTFFYKKIP